MSDKDAMKHFRTYAAPPYGFDPDDAPPRCCSSTVCRAGRTPVKEPQLRAMWDNVFSSKPTFITAEIAIDHSLTRRKRPVILKRANTLRFSPSGWAGVVKPVNFNPPEPGGEVYGEWFIPTSRPFRMNRRADRPSGSGCGIDGFGNNQVLQAGTGGDGDRADHRSLGLDGVVSAAGDPGDELFRSSRRLHLPCSSAPTSRTTGSVRC
jgi:hypothetical protein